MCLIYVAGWSIVGFMKSTFEIRLEIIRQIKELVLDISDPGDWNKKELAEATIEAENLAELILDSLSVEVKEVSENGFILSGSLTDVRSFMDIKMNEPLLEPRKS